jgi:hypothetical protein
VTHSTNAINTAILYAALLIMVVLRQRTRGHPANATLLKGERLRPLAITMMDPVLSVVFVGVVLWDLATRDVVHAVVALLGAIIGLPIGILRARVQFVRAVPEAKGVVFRRSGAEYALLALLLVLRLAETSVQHARSTALTCVLAGLVALAVSESFARTTAIVLHYRRDTAHPTVQPVVPE